MGGADHGSLDSSSSDFDSYKHRLNSCHVLLSKWCDVFEVKKCNLILVNMEIACAFTLHTVSCILCIK